MLVFLGPLSVGLSPSLSLYFALIRTLCSGEPAKKKETFCPATNQPLYRTGSLPEPSAFGRPDPVAVFPRVRPVVWWFCFDRLPVVSTPPPLADHCRGVIVFLHPFFFCFLLVDFARYFFEISPSLVSSRASRDFLVTFSRAPQSRARVFLIICLLGGSGCFVRFVSAFLPCNIC